MIALMRNLLSVFIVVFAGWTLTVHSAMTLSMGLRSTIFLGLFVIPLLLILYVIVFYIDDKKEFFASKNTSEYTQFKPHLKLTNAKLLLIIVTPFTINISWLVFWLMSIFVLLYCFFSKRHQHFQTVDNPCDDVKFKQLLAFFSIIAVSIILALSISKSDLDDSFYVAISAFYSSHPSTAILSSDPMLGGSLLPLIFPSYRFGSFELLSGAIGYLLNTPAMSVYYIYLLPIWTAFSIVVIFLFSKQYLSSKWCAVGVVTFLLILLLGEMPRSPANFYFLRLFQGKAVYLSVIVPAIFIYTDRFLSSKGKLSDLITLYCCQIAAIGFTNFGMLAAPLTMSTAIITSLYFINFKENKRKIFLLFTPLFIPFPYLLTVALESTGSIVMTQSVEKPQEIFFSIFGQTQIYLVSFIILMGAMIAKDKKTSALLIIPFLIFFAIFLNPIFLPYLAKYITTPPVYWRVIWAFPVLSFLALSVVILFSPAKSISITSFQRFILISVLLGLVIYSLPKNTLRHENIGDITSFAKWKISDKEISISRYSMQAYPRKGLLLAPEEISGVISRFENHPPLVGTRFFYFDMLRTQSASNDKQWDYRKLLFNFVAAKPTDLMVLKSALNAMDITIIVKQAYVQSSEEKEFIETLGYRLVRTEQGYNIWQLSN